MDKGRESDDEAVKLADRIYSGLDAKSYPRNDSVRSEELKASLLQMKEKFQKARSTYTPKRKGAQPRKRKRKLTTEKEIWTDCFFPCPCCGDQLRAWTTGDEPKHKVKVQSLAGPVVIFSNGDLRLPCALCLAPTQAYAAENWQKVSFDPEQLHTDLKKRPRQHWARHKPTKVKVRSSLGTALKTFGNQLLCSALHVKTVKEISLEVSSFMKMKSCCCSCCCCCRQHFWC